MEGRELRLKQEYFLCSATLQDIVRRFKTYRSRMGGSGRKSFAEFPEKVCCYDYHMPWHSCSHVRLLSMHMCVS